MNLQELLKSYENKGNSNYNKPNFFQLKDDGDNALVKILLKDEQDIRKFVKEVHMVKINGYDNKVECLGEGKCRCCDAGIPKKLVLMMPLYNAETKQVELWQRGITMIKDLVTMLDEYGDLSQETFKIVRSGKAKSKDTKYSMVYSKKQVECDKTNADAPALVGRDFKLVLGLSPEQQEEAILEGTVTWTKKEQVATVENDESAF